MVTEPFVWTANGVCRQIIAKSSRSGGETATKWSGPQAAAAISGSLTVDANQLLCQTRSLHSYRIDTRDWRFEGVTRLRSH